MSNTSLLGLRSRLRAALETATAQQATLAQELAEVEEKVAAATIQVSDLIVYDTLAQTLIVPAAANLGDSWGVRISPDEIQKLASALPEDAETYLQNALGETLTLQALIADLTSAPHRLGIEEYYYRLTDPRARKVKYSGELWEVVARAETLMSSPEPRNYLFEVINRHPNRRVYSRTCLLGGATHEQ